MSESSSEIIIRAKFEDEASEGIDRLKQNAESLKELPVLLSAADLAYVDALNSANSFRDDFTEIMTSTALNVRGGFEHLISGAVDALAVSLSALVTHGRFAAAEFGKAMLELSARAVLAIGQQAAVKAVFAIAEFFLFKDPMALTAAKFYGTVAAMATAVGAGLMGAAASVSSGGGSSSQSGRSPRGSLTNPATTSGTLSETGPNITVIVKALDPASVRWDELAENHIGPSLEKMTQRGATNLQLKGI